MMRHLFADKGTYTLIMRCRKTVRTTVGKLGTVELRPGFYIYVGSALGPGGIRARVSRHYRRRKKLHWHIDYIRRHTVLIEAWYAATTINREHDWAAALATQFESGHDRFGASDCRCASHLFFSPVMPSCDTIDAGRHETCGPLQVERFTRASFSG